MDEPILKVHELFVNYGKISVLRDVSLTVHRGEIVALVGANGAGKSTLLQAISGLLKPRSGEIWFNGERIDGRQPNRILRAGIAHVPEGRRVFPRFDVRANLRMGGYSRSDFGDLGPEIEHILDEVPALRRRADSPAGSLSGGEQQLLAIHRALMGRPELLLLDEPTMGLAPVLVDGVLDLVAAMNRDGRTILLVEQNALAVLDIADRAYVLSAGSVVTEGAAADLLGRADFASSYLGL